MSSIWRRVNYSWVGLGLAAIFLLFPGPERLWGWLWLPAGWGLDWAACRRWPMPVTPFSGALLALSLTLLPSLLAAYDWRLTLSKLGGMILGISVFGVVAGWARTPGRWAWASGGFVGLGGVVAGAALLGTTWTVKFSALAPLVARLPPPLFRLPGAEDGLNPNGMTGALLWVLPMAGYLIWRGPIGQRLAGVGLGAAMALVIGLAQSRGGYWALAIATLFGWVLQGPWPHRWRRVGIAVVVGLGLAGVGVVVINAATGLATAGVGASVTETADTRLELWSRALQGIRDFPITGMGLNMFRTAAPVLYPLFIMPSKMDIAHAHNEFLQAALDLGLPGLVAFLSVNMVAFASLGLIWRRASSPAQHAAAATLAAGLLAHLLFGLTDAVALGAKVGILFWILLGLIAGLFHQVMSAPASDSAPHA